MSRTRVPQLLVTCLYCERLYEASEVISLNPVCPDCEASRGRPAKRPAR